MVYNTFIKIYFGGMIHMNTGIPDDSVKDYYRLLTASKKGKNVKQKLRYDTILLYLEGYPGKQISEILHIPAGSRCGCFRQLDGCSGLRFCETEIWSNFHYPGNAQSFSAAGAELYQTDLYIE